MIKYDKGTLSIEFHKSILLSIMKYLLAWPVVLYGMLVKCMSEDYEVTMAVMGVITVVFYAVAFILTLVFFCVLSKQGNANWALLVIAWFLCGCATPAAIKWRQAYREGFRAV